MSKTIANCSIWMDRLAISSQVNQASIEASADQKESTTFSNAGVARLAGLRDGAISVAGLWECLPDPEDMFFADVGAITPMTIAMGRNAAAGAVAYLMGAEVATYGGIGGKVGDPMAFSIKGAQADGGLLVSSDGARLAQGVLAENRTVTASGVGNIYGPLPAPGIMQEICACTHITAASGTTPTLTLTLQSSASISMSSPTARIVFGAYTAVNSDARQVAGPITDTYWQFIWTVGGTTPSFSFAASLGNAY